MFQRVVSGLGQAALQMGLLASLLLPLALLADPGPSNDNFANAAVIGGSLETNIVLSGSNIDATLEQGEPFHAGSPSGRSVWWTWTATVNGSVTISTEGSSFDTLLGVYTGSSVGGVVPVTGNDDVVGKKTSRVLFRAIGGETYRIAVDGFQGESGAIVLTLAQAGVANVPAWELTDIDGKLIKSSDYQNKVLLIDFWSITCAGCIEEMPGFVSMQNELRAAGFQIVGLYKSTQLYEVQSISQGLHINFPMAELTPAVEQKLAPYQTRPASTISAFPTTFVFDREGRLVTQVADGGKDLAFFQELIRPLMRVSRGVRLQTKLEGGSLKLTWPGAENFDIIESTTNLTSGAWSTEAVIFGQNSLMRPAGGESRFYRLRKPTPAAQ